PGKAATDRLTLSGEREQIAILAPSAAKAAAQANPIPFEPPVMSTVLPLRSSSNPNLLFVIKLLALNGRSVAAPAARGLENRIPPYPVGPVADAGLFDVTHGGEGEMEACNQRFLCCRHVVELLAGLRGLLRIEIEYSLPIRVEEEQFRNIRDVRLHEHSCLAG